MADVFELQSLLTLAGETNYSSLGSADPGTTKILYEKPGGELGSWPATISGTKLIYNLVNGDIDQSGDWIFQTYFEVGGLKSMGKKYKKYFDRPLL